MFDSYLSLLKETWANEYRIVAIDPGSKTLGLCLITVNLDTGTITVNDILTYSAHEAIRYYPDWMLEAHGEMRCRLHAHRRRLKNVLEGFRPHAVAAESAYLGRFAASFESLTEGLSMVRGVVYDYDPTMSLVMVAPATAKQHVGAPGNGSYKDEVREGVLNYPGITWEVDPSAIDEHSADSGAIGIYVACTVLNELA